MGREVCGAKISAARHAFLNLAVKLEGGHSAAWIQAHCPPPALAPAKCFSHHVIIVTTTVTQLVRCFHVQLSGCRDLSLEAALLLTLRSSSWSLNISRNSSNSICTHDRAGALQQASKPSAPPLQTSIDCSPTHLPALILVICLHQSRKLLKRHLLASQVLEQLRQLHRSYQGCSGAQPGSAYRQGGLVQPTRSLHDIHLSLPAKAVRSSCQPAHPPIVPLPLLSTALKAASYSLSVPSSSRPSVT